MKTIRLPKTQIVDDFFCNVGHIGKAGLEDGRIGEITGTITFTDMPSSAKIYPNLNDVENRIMWGNIDPSGVTGTTANKVRWSIPIFDIYEFSTDSEYYFSLYIRLHNDEGEEVDAYEVGIPDFTVFVDDYYFDVGYVGSVSLKYITLIGTINVTYNGNPVPHVEIWAFNEDSDNFEGLTNLVEPQSNEPWSILLTALTAPNKFRLLIKALDVNEDLLFEREHDMGNVFNQDISGIVLDIGDISP